MAESTGTPLPPPAATPKKTSPWIIAIVVIVVICCGIFGIAGLIFGFWDSIKQALGMQVLLPVLTLLP